MAQQKVARRSPSGRTIEQALGLHREGRLVEAEHIYAAILAANPRHFPALHLSGLLHYQQGRFPEALRLVAAALRAEPASADALRDYGAILMALDRPEEALASYDRLTGQCANDAGLHYNRGNAQKRLGRYADALASYDRAIALAPDLLAAHHNRGSTLAELERYEEALASFDRALTLTSHVADRIEAFNNRGLILTKLKRFDDALANYAQLLALSPDHADGIKRRGLVLADLGRYAEAIAQADPAHVPDLADALVNRGNAFVGLSRMVEAAECFAAAAALHPQHPSANFNEGMCRLCLGDFENGWRQYEHRWDTKEYAIARPTYPRPLWRGEKDINGKTILLCAEQGLGDAIQFVRYAPLVAALGAKVLVGVHGPLTTLFASVPGISEVFADGAALPHFDLYSPLLSLPLAFGTTLPTIPAAIPYLRPAEQRLAKWRERMPQTGRQRIGICWAGASIHGNNHNRSIPLERFAKILSIPGLDFISLQKDCSEADAAILRDRSVTHFAQEFEDFADTAAVIAMLDLVIAVDTSVAHLAGAMGKAVGVLIAFSPDFRWMLDRTDSPWYPTMRLFRQSAIGDWDTTLDRVHQELSAVASRPAGPR